MILSMKENSLTSFPYGAFDEREWTYVGMKETSVFAAMLYFGGFSAKRAAKEKSWGKGNDEAVPAALSGAPPEGHP